MKLTPAISVLLLVVLSAIAARELFPKRIERPAPPPSIVTVYDTVFDTLRIVQPKPGKVTTDTLRLVIRETLYDTTYVNVGAVPEERTDIWPILSLTAGQRRGDTTTVTSFSLRTGQGSVAKLWTPGPILGVWVDSAKRTPRVDFGEFPTKPRTSVVTKLLWSGLGYGACKVTGALLN